MATTTTTSKFPVDVPYPPPEPRSTFSIGSIKRAFTFGTSSSKAVFESPSSLLPPSKRGKRQTASDRWWVTAEPHIRDLVSRTHFNSETGSSPMVQIRRRQDKAIPAEECVVDVTTSQEEYARQLQQALDVGLNMSVEGYRGYIEVRYRNGSKIVPIKPYGRASVPA